MPSDEGAIDLTTEDDGNDNEELTLDSQFLPRSDPAPVIAEKKEPADIQEEEEDPLAEFEAWLKSDAVIITS